MSLDDRLREEFRRVAATAPDTVAAGTRDLVAGRVAAIRRRRRVVVAVAACAGLVGLGLTAGMSVVRAGSSEQPGGRPSLTESRAPTSSFTSALYGYTVSYPMGWVVTPATTRWTHGTNDPDDPGVSDVFQSPGTARVEIAVQQLPPGWSATTWEADFLPHPVPAQQAVCYPAPKDWARVVIGGHTGGLLGRVSWCGFTEGVTVVGQRAFLIRGVVDPETLTVDSFDMGVLSPMFDSFAVP